MKRKKNRNEKDERARGYGLRWSKEERERKAILDKRKKEERTKKKEEKKKVKAFV